MVLAGLSNLPLYVDRDSVKKSLMRQERKSVTQAHLERLKRQVSNSYYHGRYKTAYKAATLALKPSSDHTDFGKRGGGYVLPSIVSML